MFCKLIENQKGSVILDNSIKKHEKTTQKFINLIENDANLKKLLQKDIELAKHNNPDKLTNPAQSLEELYDFLDWSTKCMPWECLKDLPYNSLYSKIDQATGYMWYIFDQPLEELEDKGYYYPSLQYHEPIASWIKEYSKTWGDFLSKKESWNNDYYNLVLKDDKFGLSKGWYGNKNIWTSFNDFFARKLIDASQRPISSADMVSPADSYPKGFYKIDASSRVIGDNVFVKTANIKGVDDLIGKDCPYCKHFANGTLTHCFLDINDYHRYHFPVDGTIVYMQKISAANAGGGITKWNQKEKRYEYFNELGFQMIETRDCIILQTAQFDYVAILPIGMSQVCSCNLEQDLFVGKKVKKGDPLGYFMFGGSDIVVIFDSSVECVPLIQKEHLLMGEPYANLLPKH